MRGIPMSLISTSGREVARTPERGFPGLGDGNYSASIFQHMLDQLHARLVRHPPRGR